MKKDSTLAAARTDERNIAFWDELCGTSQAQQLGITDSSPRSLEKFDAWYFEVYPYLFDHVRLQGLRDGSGRNGAPPPATSGIARARRTRQRSRRTVSRRELRLRDHDWLPPPHRRHGPRDRRMPADAVAGRSLIAMVYYVYSYRRWMQARRQTLNYLWSEMSGYRGVATPESERKGDI
jgi:hypothetical protein